MGGAQALRAVQKEPSPMDGRPMDGRVLGFLVVVDRANPLG